MLATGRVQVDAMALSLLHQERDALLAQKNDLLAALETCQAFIDQVPERNAAGTEAWCAYHEARVAIAKART